ncbi:hypothetical protein PTSG_01128 [Salpingoeca rosetta]|uniref:Anaphase-promoting complex subunit 6 n=1 Tax=Salpingoeca rosetta (strain ATCC 50818 / BSB-021) TaxID=946362 RepID=F2U0W3_SALR5|nr:uncharacterized protein PTSG_01128 [Salpingoeca rosetta]EGD80537.1 hypothetical protein PTSG_01128 [Salpingoeca rosetta]|eukprot:XP_004997098.1 hypothetical protein PTSG_01128 [Salpingoeca rosetta]
MRWVETLRRKVKEYMASSSFASAAFWADKIVTATDGALEDVYLLAKAYMSLQQYERAMHVLVKYDAVRQSPAARLIVGQCFTALDRGEEALDVIGVDDEHLDELRVADAEVADFHPIADVRAQLALLRGKIFENQDNRIKAIRSYRAALNHDPFCAEALQRLADHHLLKHSEETQLVASILPVMQDKLASEEEGDILTDITDFLYSSLFERYQEVPISDQIPIKLLANPDIQVSRAAQLFNQGQFEESFTITTKVLDNDKFNEACLPFHIACQVELKEINSLFYLAHQLVDNMPQKAVTWFAVGSYYFATKFYEVARTYFSKATTKDVSFGPAWIGFAHAFAVEGEHDQAMAAYSNAVRILSGSHLPLLYMGMEYAQTNNRPIAMRYYRQAADIYDADPAIFHEMGVLHYHEGRHDDAIKCFNKARKLFRRLRLAPARLHSTLVNLARVRLRLEEYEEAVQLYEEALSLVPDSGVAHAGLAFIYHLRDDFERAIQYYHKALALNPSDAFCEQMLAKALAEQVQDFDLPAPDAAPE